MNKFLFIGLLVASTAFSTPTPAKGSASGPPDHEVFGFYYNWYGNTQTNGSEIHWGHGVIKNQGYNGPDSYIPGRENLASNFYPALKNYSSTDSATIARHMEMMAQARIGVVVVTWWGNRDFGSLGLPILLDEAEKHGLKVCFHIEPYNKRSAASIRENIRTLTDAYGSHPAFYRLKGRPCFFIYDSYLIPAEEWATLLQPDGAITIRGTELDAAMIGLWVKADEQDFFKQSGMDGFYTYFAATGFTYGSTPANWKSMQQWARDNGKLFIPCVGPGYIDTRVRPWNAGTTRDRKAGKYYDEMFRAAIDSGAPCIGITSFNEWHEGTQIEPAVPFACKEFTYLDYSPLAPDYYLTRTAYWVAKRKK